MKKQIKTLIVTVAILAVSIGLNAQGLYKNNQDSGEEGNGLYKESPVLKGKPGGQTPEPGEETPISDGLWIMLLVSGAYGIKTYAKSRKRTV